MIKHNNRWRIALGIVSLIDGIVLILSLGFLDPGLTTKFYEWSIMKMFKRGKWFTLFWKEQ